MRLAPDRPALLVEEQVVNEADRPYEIAWGHHPAFDVAPGALIDLPAGPRWRSDPGPWCRRPTWSWAPKGDGRLRRARWQHEVDLRAVPRRAAERVVYLAELRAGGQRSGPDGVASGSGWPGTSVAFPHVWLWQDIGGSTRFWAVDHGSPGSSRKRSGRPMACSRRRSRPDPRVERGSPWQLADPVTVRTHRSGPRRRPRRKHPRGVLTMVDEDRSTVGRGRHGAASGIGTGVCGAAAGVGMDGHRLGHQPGRIGRDRVAHGGCQRSRIRGSCRGRA